jgi:hypothetical protein
MLHKGIQILLPTLVLVQVFRASYALGYLPKACREVEVFYVPKAGNKDPEKPFSYKLLKS